MRNLRPTPTTLEPRLLLAPILLASALTVNAAAGAGVQAAQLVANRDVEVVLTGNCGPNAFRTLQAAEIAVVTGATGSARDALAAYKAGKLTAAQDANVVSHFGMA